MISETVEAAIAVLIDAHGLVLLTRRGLAMRSFPGKWCFPGGAVDRLEIPSMAAVREAREEIGLLCGSPRLLGVFSSHEPARNRKHRVHAFLMEHWSGSVRFGRDSTEVIDHVWIEPLEALRALALAGPVTAAVLHQLAGDESVVMDRQYEVGRE